MMDVMMWHYVAGGIKIAVCVFFFAYFLIYLLNERATNNILKIK